MRNSFIDGNNPELISNDKEKRLEMNILGSSVIGTRLGISKEWNEFGAIQEPSLLMGRFFLGHDIRSGSTKDFLRVMEIVCDPKNHPVLVFCKGARHRSRMIQSFIRRRLWPYFSLGPSHSVSVGSLVDSVGSAWKRMGRGFSFSSPMMRLAPSEQEIIDGSKRERAGNLDFLRFLDKAPDKYRRQLDRVETLLDVYRLQHDL